MVAGSRMGVGLGGRERRGGRQGRRGPPSRAAIDAPLALAVEPASAATAVVAVAHVATALACGSSECHDDDHINKMLNANLKLPFKILGVLVVSKLVKKKSSVLPSAVLFVRTVPENRLGEGGL